MDSQWNGKFLLRSTPWAFCLVPASSPSGLRSPMIHRSASANAGESASAVVTAIPALSLPWMQPTTSTRLALPGLPTSVTVRGRPLTDVPNLVVLLTVEGDGESGADGD